MNPERWKFLWSLVASVLMAAVLAMSCNLGPDDLQAEKDISDDISAALAAAKGGR